MHRSFEAKQSTKFLNSKIIEHNWLKQGMSTIFIQNLKRKDVLDNGVLRVHDTCYFQIFYCVTNNTKLSVTPVLRESYKHIFSTDLLQMYDLLSN